MKKSISVLLILILIFSLSIPAFAAAKVQLSQQKLTVNGESITCEKYNIDGSNYFKLRDLAKLLSGTENQFEVGYKDGVVTITTGQAYTSNGSELIIGKDKSSTAVVSKQTIMINGVKNSSLSAYNIGGNNFFKLRDLGNVIGFNVDFNASTNTAIVSTGKAIEKQVTVIDTITYYSNNNMNSTVSYSYDSNGNISTEKTKNTSYPTTTTYTYDSQNRLIKQVYTSDDYSYSYEYKYDSQNRLIKEVFTSDYNSYSNEYKYDSHNNIIEKYWVNLNTNSSTTDSSIEKIIYKYDNSGNIIEQKGQYETITNTYDLEGRLTKSVTDHNGEGKSWVTYTYYSNGNVKTKIDTSIAGDNFVYDYTYDSNGNVTVVKYHCDTNERGNGSNYYTYDNNGNLLKEHNVYYDNSTSDAVYTYKTISIKN